MSRDKVRLLCDPSGAIGTLHLGGISRLLRNRGPVRPSWLVYPVSSELVFVEMHTPLRNPGYIVSC